MKMKLVKNAPRTLLLLLTLSCLVLPASAAQKKHATATKTKHAAPTEWTFIVSGDSRNCGDVVMPAIAANSAQYHPSFYWHLGDLRAIYKIDEDMLAASSKNNQVLACDAYEKQAWPDFIEHQIAPFGTTPFYIGIGNHELMAPENEDKFTLQFADWLDTPSLHSQRLLDNANDHLLKPYYHWHRGGVDFIFLDNASDSFGADQLGWFDHILANDILDSHVHSVIIGMHEALPGSLAASHSMGSKPNEADSASSGTHVYQALVAFRNQTHKPVYVLASHSHFYMDGIFSSMPEDQRLPGWIVGTAGAVRYKLPEGAPSSAKTDVYGYLLATVSGHKIKFEFKQLQQSDVPDNMLASYGESFVKWCFEHNSQNIDPEAKDTNKCGQ